MCMSDHCHTIISQVLKLQNSPKAKIDDSRINANQRCKFPAELMRMLEESSPLKHSGSLQAVSLLVMRSQ